MPRLRDASTKPGGGDRLARSGRVAEAVAAGRPGSAPWNSAPCSSSSTTPRPRRPRRPRRPARRLGVAVRRCRSRCRSPRHRAGSRRSARSAFRRARRPGGGAARCRLRSRAGSRRGPARVRASARNAPSSGRRLARPASISASASSSARRRAVPGASAVAGSSPGVEERLAEPGLAASARPDQGFGLFRRRRRVQCRFVHVRSTDCRAAPSVEDSERARCRVAHGERRYQQRIAQTLGLLERSPAQAGMPADSRPSPVARRPPSAAAPLRVRSARDRSSGVNTVASRPGRPHHALRDARLVEVLRDPAEEERVARAEHQARVDVLRRVDDPLVEDVSRSRRRSPRARPRESRRRSAALSAHDDLVAARRPSSSSVAESGKRSG